MISVIVPFRDAETTVGRCCESLHKQDGDFEFVFVDDNSEDGGPEILLNYVGADKRFRILENWYRSGVSGARNTGLDAARGEWITFLDADDMLADKAYKILSSVIREGLNVVQFNHWRRYARTGRTVVPNKYRNGPGIYDVQHLPKSWYYVWNKLYRAEFLKGIRFVEGMQYGEDELFVLECLAKENKIVHQEGAAAVHTFDSGNRLSRRKTEEDLIDQARGLENFILQHDDPKVRTAACMILAEHWASPSYIKIVGRSE